MNRAFRQSISEQRGLAISEFDIEQIPTPRAWVGRVSGTTVTAVVAVFFTTERCYLYLGVVSDRSTSIRAAVPGDSTTSSPATPAMLAPTTTTPLAPPAMVAIRSDGDVVTVDPSGAATVVYDGADPNGGSPPEGGLRDQLVGDGAEQRAGPEAQEQPRGLRTLLERRRQRLAQEQGRR